MKIFLVLKNGGKGILGDEMMERDRRRGKKRRRRLGKMRREEGEEIRREGGCGRGGGEEEEEREKDRKGQEVPSSPSISFQACRRLAGSHGLGVGWRVCSAEPPVFRGPQACLPQGPHSWCLLPLSSPARLWVQGKKRNFRSEQGNRKYKKTTRETSPPQLPPWAWAPPP